jgi:hypothetical protein
VVPSLEHPLAAGRTQSSNRKTFKPGESWKYPGIEGQRLLIRFNPNKTTIRNYNQTTKKQRHREALENSKRKEANNI